MNALNWQSVLKNYRKEIQSSLTKWEETVTLGKLQNFMTKSWFTMREERGEATDLKPFGAENSGSPR
jgi:hypothetical protein